MHASAETIGKVIVSARVIRADGSVEDRGVVSEQDLDAGTFARILAFLKGDQ